MAQPRGTAIGHAPPRPKPCAGGQPSTRLTEGWKYLAEEATFGPEDTDSHPPVELTLNDGTTVRFREQLLVPD